jgi:hypothetical protein
MQSPVPSSKNRLCAAHWLLRKVTVSLRNLAHLWNWCLALGVMGILSDW